MREGSALRLDVALAENLNDMNNFDQLASDVNLEQHTMVKDVFNIGELFVQLNELNGGCMAVMQMRSHCVCNPKVRNSHDENLFQTLKVRGKVWENRSYFLAFKGFRETLRRPLLCWQHLIWLP